MRGLSKCFPKTQENHKYGGKPWDNKDHFHAFQEAYNRASTQATHIWGSLDRLKHTWMNHD